MNPGLLVAAVLAFSLPSSEEASSKSAEILSQPRYAFCDPAVEIRLWEDEREWCPLLSATRVETYDDWGNPLVSGFTPRSHVCPGFAPACERPPAEAELIPMEFGGAGGGSGEAGERRANAGGSSAGGGAGPAPEPEPEPETIEIPQMSGLAQIFLWIVLGLALFFIIRAIVKNASDTAEEEESPDEDDKAPVAAAEEKPRGPVETDVDRLLRRAREAAARGEFEQAMDDSYAALLRHLEGNGKIDVHPHRTNGDYLIDLRGEPDLRRGVRDVVRDVELVQFGDRVPDKGLFDGVFGKITRLLGRAGPLVLALLPFAGISCDFESPESAHQAQLGGLSSDPLGTRAVANLLREHELDVRHRTRTLEQLGQTKGAIVLLPGADPVDEEWTILREWVDDGGILVVANGTSLPPDSDWDLAWSDSTDSTLLPTESIGWWTYEMGTPPLNRLHRREHWAASSVLVERESEVYMVREFHGQGQMVLVADGSLFANVSLMMGDNGAWLVALFDHLDSELETIELVDAFTGTGADNPLESLDNAEMTPILLQLLAFVALLFLWRGIAFARLRDPPESNRRAFVDHVRALGRRYARARAGHHVARLYAGWALESLRERLLTHGRGLHPLAQAIAARTGRDEGEVMALLVQAHELQRGLAHSEGVKADLLTVRSLARLLHETASSRR